jgi:hypothetical protein
MKLLMGMVYFFVSGIIEEILPPLFLIDLRKYRANLSKAKAGKVGAATATKV